MKDYLDIFKLYLINDKKASSNTYESYMRDINQFVSYCTSLKILDTAEITNEGIKSYLDYLTSIKKSDSTKSRITASLRCYYRFLKLKGFTADNPVDGIRLKKAQRKLPGVLELDEILLLLSQPDVNEYKGIRDKAMLELLYATGIKVSELIDLRVSDVNLQIGIIRLQKGGKERVIPLFPVAVKSISDYINNVRPFILLDKDEDRLFTNMSGTQMSRQGFWKIIKHYADLAGIKKDITPHTFRHSFAAHLLENGAKLTDIKDMLGHSDISSTQIYSQLMKSKYTNAYAKYHPLAK